MFPATRRARILQPADGSGVMLHHSHFKVKSWWYVNDFLDTTVDKHKHIHTTCTQAAIIATSADRADGIAAALQQQPQQQHEGDAIEHSNPKSTFAESLRAFLAE